MLDEKRKRKGKKKGPDISSLRVGYFGYTWTQVVKADEWESHIYLKKLHLFREQAWGGSGDVSLCGRVALDEMNFVDAYPELADDKDACKLCAWAFIRM
jgi:hypothetical protein